LVEHLARGLRLLWQRYAVWRNRPAFRLLRGLAAFGIVGASCWFIWRQISTGYATISISSFRVEPLQLTISSLCVAGATALGAWEWVLLVNALGGDLGVVQGMSIHLTSNLAKYVPGFVWPFLGKAYLASQHGVPTSIAAASIGGELAIVYWTGGLVILVSPLLRMIWPWPASQWFALPAAAGFVLLTSLIALLFRKPLLTRWAGRISRTQHVEITPNWRRIAVVAGAGLLAWYLLGIGFGTLCMSESNVNLPDLLRSTYALASALLIGQLAFVVPTGLGVREAALVSLLATGHSTTQVVLAAVVFRTQTLAGEAVCALLALALSKLRSRRTKERPTGHTTES